MLFQRIEALAGAELTMFRIIEDLHARGLRVRSALYGSKAAEISRQFPALNPVILPVTRTRSVIVPLARLLRRERPDVLLSALTMTNCAAAAGAMLSATSTAVVLTEHNPVVARCRHQGARRMAYLRLLRTSYRMAHAVVAVSSGVGDEISRITGGAVRARIIHNPVATKGPEPCETPPHPWLESGQPPCIMGIGRLRPEKNFALLLEAFADLARARPCRLIILGEGTERARLEALRDQLGLHDRVLLPGFVPRPGDWLQHAALFVCSSAYEGFGNVIVEALECGVSVVSTDCPFGPAEILAGGTFGRLVPNDRSDLLATAMAESLDQPMAQEMLRARASMFSRDRAVDAYVDLLSEFL
jgi:glycosyltransferase involved in cell wall biosynthesis